MSMLLKGRFVPAADDVIVSRDRRSWIKVPVDVSASDDPASDRFVRTQQHFKEECDINTIMKRFERTGMIDHYNEFQGQYGEFYDAPQSYHEACNQVLAAQAMFMTIPAAVRAEFQNDPGVFLEFVQKPENEARLVELGLARFRGEPASERQGGPEAPGEAGA